MDRFKYLWFGRVRFPFGTKAFWKCWAKRLLTLPTFLSGTARHGWLRWKGAELSSSAVLSSLDLGGHASRFSVGDHSFVGRASIMLQDSVTIGARVCINDYVTILTATHDTQRWDWAHIKRPVRIDDYAWIATGATILPGVHIGVGAVVGANAVVSRDVPPYPIAVGNPAKIIDRRRCETLEYSPVAFLAVEDAWLGAPTRAGAIDAFDLSKLDREGESSPSETNMV
jgi:maltose O-acetyltransferase